MHDVWLMLIFGLGAFILRKLDYPPAPAGGCDRARSIAEPTLRQSLLLSPPGDLSIFFNRPIAGPITIIAIILILLPLFKVIWNKVRAWRRKRPDTLAVCRERRTGRRAGWTRKLRDMMRGTPGSARRSLPASCLW
ncbi:MAG: hypothetical protein R3C97_19340 [Geminicoccaceae bacterium]